MNLHTLSPAKGATRPKRRLGRGHGSGSGKTSGKGHKGQMARSGHKHKATFEGGQMPLVRRIPKRGFKNVNDIDYVPVNVGALAVFEEGAEVDVLALRTAGLARGPVGLVKILGTGDLAKRLTVKAHAFSASARKKIEDAGGACEVIQ